MHELLTKAPRTRSSFQAAAWTRVSESTRSSLKRYAVPLSLTTLRYSFELKQNIGSP